MEPDRELEAGVGFHVGGGPRLDAPRKFLVGQHVRAPLAVRDPVLQRRHVLAALDDERLAADRVGPAGRPRGLGGPHDSPALVDPHAHRHVDELVGGADRVLDVHERRERRLRGVVPASGGSLATGVLRRGDDFEIPRLELVVDLLPAWQIERSHTEEIDPSTFFPRKSDRSRCGQRRSGTANSGARRDSRTARAAAGSRRSSDARRPIDDDHCPTLRANAVS